MTENESEIATGSQADWVLRDEVDAFVVNGYTKHSMPIIHTPDCHHVREAFPPYVGEPLVDVLPRFPRTGRARDDLKQVDLLAALFSAPGDRVGRCQACLVRRP